MTGLWWRHPMCRSMNYKPLSSPTFPFIVIGRLSTFLQLSVSLRSTPPWETTAVHLDKCTSQPEREKQVGRSQPCACEAKYTLTDKCFSGGRELLATLSGDVWKHVLRSRVLLCFGLMTVHFHTRRGCCTIPVAAWVGRVHYGGPGVPQVPLCATNYWVFVPRVWWSI